MASLDFSSLGGASLETVIKPESVTGISRLDSGLVFSVDSVPVASCAPIRREGTARNRLRVGRGHHLHPNPRRMALPGGNP